ncbi:MAG: DUF134 domain-containing protein [archaeon]|nr:DUF134 domain-containing protein [archaeon]
MPRPKRNRIVQRIPIVKYFKPQGIPMRDLMEEIITIDEFEALRLKHYENLNQTQCSKKMHISQSTFSRILESAHKKFTAAIIEGKAIRFDGGKFLHFFLGYGCLNCDHEWEIHSEDLLILRESSKIEIGKLLPDPLKNEIKCPNCNSSKIYKLKKNAI